MTIKQKIAYFFCAVGFFLLLALFDFFVIGYIVSLITENWKIQLAVFVVLILLVNPFIVLLIMKKMPFKVKGLKVEDGLNSALKKETM